MSKGLALRHRATLALAAALAVLPAAAADAPWVGAWSAAMLRAPAPGNAVRGPLPAVTVAHRTLRALARVGVAGAQLRIVLDNRYGDAPVTFDAASVGLRDVGANLRPDSLRALRFGGRTAVTVAPGQEAQSDPLDLAVQPGDVLGVSLYVAGRSVAGTWHPDPRNAQYLSGAGDRTRDPALADAEGLPGVAWLARIDVRPTAPASAVVALGDSITNGFQASQLAAWPDALQDRLAAARCPRAVLNAGINANQVAAEQGNFGLGEAMRERVAHDALAVPGVRYLIVLGGINDIGLAAAAAHARGAATPSAQALAAPVIAAQRAIIAAARARGVRVYGGTVLPYAGTTRTYTAAGEAARRQLNAWIRGPAGYDGVIDFDRALRDPAHPERLRADYDSGDSLHPSDAGYRAMAAAVPLALFDCPPASAHRGASP
jgi:lysophospholipase L1-like esterase